MRPHLALTVLILAACTQRQPPPPRGPNADSARAVALERNVAGAPPAEPPDTRQLKRVIHELAVVISNARTHPKDTADAPRWTSVLDAIADEMPAASDSNPKYALAYQHTKDAITLARQDRLNEAYAYADTAFKLLR
jgi:hypothetical protein